MKHEYVHRNTLIKKSIVEDVTAAYSVFKTNDISDMGLHGKIKGYIQKITNIPFGYLLFSDFQVNYY